MSGRGAPAFTATPTTELAILRSLPAAPRPSATSVGQVSGVTTSRSAVAPSRILRITTGAGANDGAKEKPVDFANSGATRSSTPLSATVVRMARVLDMGCLRFHHAAALDTKGARQ